VKLWHLALVLVVLLLVADLMRGTLRRAMAPEDELPPPPPPAAEAGGGAAAEKPPLPLNPSDVGESWGPRNAPVRLQAYLPRGNKTGERVVTAFRAVTKAYPTLTRAEIIDMSKPGVPEAMVLKGIRMPFVAVDEKTSYKVRVNGRTQEISLADVRKLKDLPLADVLKQIVVQELKLGQGASK
jgi:hypothetical protein